VRQTQSGDIGGKKILHRSIDGKTKVNSKRSSYTSLALKVHSLGLRREIGSFYNFHSPGEKRLSSGFLIREFEKIGLKKLKEPS